MDREEEIDKLRNLDFESFKELANDESLTVNQKIGFPNSYREGFEFPILQNILNVVPTITARKKLNILDIGPGCSQLILDFLTICAKQQHQVTLIDSEEMLRQIKANNEGLKKLPGYYPRDHKEFIESNINSLDCIISYSVFHYIFKAGEMFEFIDQSLKMLKPNGYMLIGDIPNISKRFRFFSSSQGIEYHQNFTKSDSMPKVELYQPQLGEIDDSIIQSIFNRYRNFGYEVYILPQSENLPMYNRREDILIRKW